MANIKIYRDDAAGVVFFESSTVNPLPVNVGVATEVAAEADRIKIVRTDKFIKGTNNSRVLFKRLNFNRIEDRDGNTFATRTDAINYLTTTFAQAAPVDVNASYLGVWDAGANNPDIVALTPANGDWFYVTATGSIDPNGNGTDTGSIDYKVDDIVKYCDQPNFTGWQYVPNETVRVDELDSTVDSIVRNSSLTQFDIHVVAHYTGSENLGTAVKPYVDIQQAVNASSNGDTILLDGDFTITASVELPTDKMLHFYGAGETTVGYASFTPLNGNVFHRASGDATKGFQFQDLTFKNAGGYGLHIEEAAHIYVIDCTFNTNGWNGTGLSTVAPETGGTLGYDSSQADLLTFGSGSNVSDGGAIEIRNTKNVQVIGCTVQANFRGIKLEDCGIGGNIFITRNVASGNIESGIYLAAGALKGTQNATLMMNFAGYNANNGLLVVGGINNKFSQNEVTGNWNGGFVSWGAANTTIRDSGFYDNNRSAYNGIGADGDADASILINDSYSYLATHFHLNPAARFITEVLGCQVQNTGLGSNTEKIGVKLTAGMGSIPDNDVNIIRIDDCGFIAQDYAIDFSTCNVTNLRISLGDNTYEGTGQFAVKAPLLGDYAELPYSSHVTDVNAVDIVTDVLRQSVTLCEGVGGNVINIYKINELQSYVNGGNQITIIQRGSDRIQLRSLALSEITINGQAVGNTINAANDNLNAAFQLTLEQYQGIVVTPLLDALTPISGYNTPLVGSLVGDDLSNGGVVQTTDTTTTGGRIFIPSGSITVGTTFGFLVGNTISTTPTSTDWEFSIVIDETGSLTFSNNDGTVSSQVLQAGTIAGETWNSHIIVDLQSNGTTIDFATSNLLTTASLLPADATTYSTEITSGTYNLTFYNDAATGTIEIPADTEVLEGDAPIGLTYYYIESPNGVFHYPLFNSLPQAVYEDNRVGGAGSGSAYTFIDDLSGQGSWYAPNTSYSGSVGSAPVNGTPTGVTWNEIPNGIDSNYVPSALSPFTASISEIDYLNQQITPPGAPWTTTLANGPAWITLNGQSNLVGTPPGVEGDSTNYPKDTYNVDVIRTNSYGSSTTTILVEVTNTSTLESTPGILHQGSVINNAAYRRTYGVNFPPTYGADYIADVGDNTERGLAYDLPGVLDDGDSIEFNAMPSIVIGIVSGSQDKTTSAFVDGTTMRNRFDLFLPIKETSDPAVYWVGLSGTDYTPKGWNDDSAQTIPGADAPDYDNRLKITNNAGRIELYKYSWDDSNFSLFLSSSVLYGTGSDAPTITLAIPTQYENPMPFPTFDLTENGAAAPTGFTLTSGSMDTSTILNSGSVATLSNLTLSPGQRMIASETWVEANVLPYIYQETIDPPYTGEVFIGIVSESADWSTINFGDFNAAHKWKANTSPNSKINIQSITGSSYDTVTVNSDTDAYYSYAIDFSREGNLSVLRQANTGTSLTTEPVGGTITNQRTLTAATASIGTSPLEIAIATTGQVKARLTTTGLSIINAPLPANQFDVTEDSYTLPLFNGDPGADITLNAGQTYKFWMHDSSIESTDTLSFVLTSDNSAYTTGVTTVGTPGTFGAYVEFVIPSDVPPVKFKWVTTGTGTTYITPTVAGSTFSAGITGITKEGPAANQTGTNIMDAGEHGWISLDETLAAGERLVLDNAFFTDFLAEVQGNNTVFAIGLKGDNWANTREVSSNGAAVGGGSAGSETFKGNTFIVGIWSGGASNVTMWVCGGGLLGNSMYMNTSSLWNSTCAFLEITSDGNNLRAGMGRNGAYGITQGDESTKTYSDWTTYKGQTVGQTYGISNIDVMMSFWTFNGGAIDGDEIDWTGLTEVSVPTPRTITTDWNKIVDFTGGSQRLATATQSSAYNALRMGDSSVTVTANSDATKTSDSSNSRPWATAVVFKSDGNNSNQHIWNSGEGANTGVDNIYLRVDASGDLYFGYGRNNYTGQFNECRIDTSISTSTWYGVYITMKGQRLSSSDATATNLANAFDIRIMSSADSFNSVGSNLSTSSNWITTGGRMDRSFTGDFTVGGRGTNRNYLGKIASMVITTLNRNATIPADAEIKLMITDPEKWLTDYKIGNVYRLPASTTTSTWGSYSADVYGASATQVWLMGDGTNDSYTNGIRNQVLPSDNTNTKLLFLSMTSNDIENVTIPGLTQT